MIVHGGQPPFIEEPNPKFGGVISKLNEISLFVAEKTENFSSSTQDRLHEFADELDAFVRDVAIPIDAHIAKVGAVHGENKGTIGLSLKDNFRAATLAEAIAMARVDAFVTSKGAKQSVLANTAEYVDTNFQQNDVIQMASYYFPNEYPVQVPSVPEPIKYFNGPSKNTNVPMILNGDRFVLSPYQVAGPAYQRNSLFVSGPTNQIGKSLMQEVQNVTSSYGSYGWNNVGARASNGKVMFFHPISDKNIYEFADGIGVSTVNNNAFLMYQGFGGVVYKGIAVSVAFAAEDIINIKQTFYSVAALETNPTLQPVVDASYKANVNIPGTVSNGVNANNTYQFDLKQVLNLPAGSTVVRLPGWTPSVSMYWNAQDIDAHLFIAVPVRITIAGKVKRACLRFVISIKPGTLRPGGICTVTALNMGTKDTMAADLVIPADAKWLEEDHVWNLNNPARDPGALLTNGDLVKVRSFKYGVMLKRYNTGFKGLRDWVMGNRPIVQMYEATSEIAVPARHQVFGPLPERVIPISYKPGEIIYLGYGLDISTGRYGWKEYGWTVNPMKGFVSGNKFGIRSPDYVTDRSRLPNVPGSLVCSNVINGADRKVTVSGLAFNDSNEFKGFKTITYSGGTLILKDVVSLSPASIFSLRAASSEVMKRAAVLNPYVAAVAALREPQIQVFKITDTRVLVMFSDGLSYVEVGIFPYSEVNGVILLDFAPTNGVKTTPVTVATPTMVGVARTSISGDNVQSLFYDAQVNQVNATTYEIAVERPFGDLYGNVSFVASNIDTVNPVITSPSFNPARLYQGSSAIDLVDPIYPSFTMPVDGLYTHSPSNNEYSTNCLCVSVPSRTTDPFDPVEAGWVRVPAGAKVLLGGRGYFLNQDYPVKVNPTGVTYCYLTRSGDLLQAFGSSVIRETSNNEVLYGVATNGVLEVSNNYLVLARHLVSSSRRGSAVPYFEDDGAKGPNKFFTQRDRI